MNDDLRELGITPEEDMEEDTKPGEVVDDRVATGEVGDKEDEDAEKDELSLEEQAKLENRESGEDQEEAE